MKNSFFIKNSICKLNCTSFIKSTGFIYYYSNYNNNICWTFQWKFSRTYLTTRKSSPIHTSSQKYSMESLFKLNPEWLSREKTMLISDVVTHSEEQTNKDRNKELVALQLKKSTTLLMHSTMRRLPSIRQDSKPTSRAIWKNYYNTWQKKNQIELSHSKLELNFCSNSS
jgi:hypothetical protein